jgi:integrase
VHLLKGKKTQTYYGTFRIDNPDGSRTPKQIRLGTVKELPTKNAARTKLEEIIKKMTAPDAQPEVKPEVKKFSALAEEWKKCVGVTLEGSSLKHYSDALRAYVLPTFGNKDIRSINREAVELFLASQAAKYSRSSLRSMRVTLCMILTWAEKNGEFQQQPQPHGWVEGIRLPKKVGGRKVTRTELTPEQTRAFVSRMKDPYSTLVLLLASVGVRGEAAVGLQPGDLDAENVLRAKRVIYDGEVIPLTEEEQKKHIFPLDAVVHAELLQRLRSLGAEAKWILHGRTGEPLNLGNARNRKLHPVAAALGIKVGGWHDFRHTLKRQMRRAGVDPVVVRDTLGHSKVEQQEVYDIAQRTEVGDALRLVGKRLLQSVLQNPSIQ